MITQLTQLESMVRLADAVPQDVGGTFTVVLSPAVIVEGLLLSALGFILTWIFGKPTLAFLRAKKIGKSIRSEEPQSNQMKMGTPTMGGIMILGSILVIAVFFVLLPTRKFSLLVPIFITVACGVLGGVDDLLSIVPKKTPPPPTPPTPPSTLGESGKGGVAVMQSVATTQQVETRRERRRRKRLEQHGLTARFKMSWLLIISAIVALTLFLGGGQEKIYIPFLKFAPIIGWWYVPICIIGIAGTANAVNLTDGLDTLAATTSATSFFAYGIIGYVQNQPQVVLLGFGIAGACLGFLWYNAYPAQVFMGDTGSLTLGALLASLAFQTNQWLLLPLIGSIFFMEAVSVILQVGYFKLTKGKRLFKMTPIHYHFLKSGWSETQVTMRFWLFGFVTAMIGVALAML